MDLILSARPQLADHSVHGFQEHVTLLQEPEFYSKEKETFNVETWFFVSIIIVPSCPSFS